MISFPTHRPRRLMTASVGRGTRIVKLAIIASISTAGIIIVASRAVGEEPPVSDEQIVSSFVQTHEGYSSDEVLVRQRLRDNLIGSIEQSVGGTLSTDGRSAIWQRLLNMRKAGHLPVRSTRRGPSVDREIIPVAEMAARAVMDRHHLTTDALLVSDRWREELHAEARKIQPDVDLDSVAKAILGLRKRRVLRPELVLTVADWGREVRTMSYNDLEPALADGRIPNSPGVYLFRDAEGYLYIGEASRLADRLNEHVGGSDRVALAEYLADRPEQTSVELHIFERESPAAKVAMRRAYESELIRSRNPKFNVRP